LVCHGKGITARALARLGVSAGFALALAVTLAPVAPAATAPAAINLPKAAQENDAFRRVLVTGKHMQLVVMHLKTGQAIGMETHADNDQLVIVVAGQARLTVDGKVSRLGPHQALLIPAGSAHDVQADGGKPAKIVVIYAPPLHPVGEVQKTKP
jgi:mannose-6-phosphate isomerase-like protein (cupin superfamily)